MSTGTAVAATPHPNQPVTRAVVAGLYDISFCCWLFVSMEMDWFGVGVGIDRCGDDGRKGRLVWFLSFVFCRGDFCGGWVHDWSWTDIDEALNGTIPHAVARRGSLTQFQFSSGPTLVQGTRLVPYKGFDLLGNFTLSLCNDMQRPAWRRSRNVEMFRNNILDLRPLSIYKTRAHYAHIARPWTWSSYPPACTQRTRTITDGLKFPNPSSNSAAPS
jgi:hypothetical protein